MSKNFLIFANLLHDPNEDSYYQTILSSCESNQLILSRPNGSSQSFLVDPFKTKSKIRHSPPKSPNQGFSSSQEEEINKENESISLFLDKVLNGKEGDLTDLLLEGFQNFLINHQNILIINWCNKISEESFSRMLSESHGIDNMEFCISSLPSQNEPKKFKLMSGWGNEYVKAHKFGSLNGMVYDFVQNLNAEYEKHFIVIDLFNVVEKVNNVSSFYETLNGLGKTLYKLLLNKDLDRSNHQEIFQIFNKIMSHHNYSIISIMNMKDIEPYYHQSLLAFKFIEELNIATKYVRSSLFFQILNENNRKLEEKCIELQKKIKMNELQLATKEEMLQNLKNDLQNFEKIKAQLKNKEDILHQMTQERNHAIEDKTFLEAILEDSETNFSEVAEKVPKESLDAQKYREFFMRLLNEYMRSYYENSIKYSKILELNEKLKENQHDLYMEREKMLLKEIKSKIFKSFFLIKIRI